MSKAKTKAKALTIGAPQNKEECAEMLARLGDLKRFIKREETHMNDLITAAKEEAAEKTLDAREQVTAMGEAVKTFCEANRQVLTDNGKVKYHNFITAEVSWRVAPPSVGIRKADDVILACKEAGYHDFIRIKEEPNKDAMLEDPSRAKTIKGVTIKSSGESFTIEIKEEELADG